MLLCRKTQHWPNWSRESHFAENNCTLGKDRDTTRSARRGPEKSRQLSRERPLGVRARLQRGKATALALVNGVDDKQLHNLLGGCVVQQCGDASQEHRTGCAKGNKSERGSITGGCAWFTTWSKLAGWAEEEPVGFVEPHCVPGRIMTVCLLVRAAANHHLHHESICWFLMLLINSPIKSKDRNTCKGQITVSHNPYRLFLYESEQMIHFLNSCWCSTMIIL